MCFCLSCIGPVWLLTVCGLISHLAHVFVVQLFYLYLTTRDHIVWSCTAHWHNRETTHCIVQTYTIHEVMCKMVTVHVQYRLCMNMQYPTTGSPQAVHTLVVSTELVRVRVKPGKDSHDHGSQRGGSLFYIFHSTLRWCVCERERASGVCTYRSTVCISLTYCTADVHHGS